MPRGLCAAGLVVLMLTAPPVRAGDAGAAMGTIWISPAQLAALPAGGPEWERLRADADAPIAPNPADQDDPSDAHTFAAALAYARSGDAAYGAKVHAACAAAASVTPPAGVNLAFARNVLGYVLAADLAGLPAESAPAFRKWLLDALPGLRLTHERRPNNFGTHAGAARVAICLYLADAEHVAEADRCWDVFRRWLGDATSPFNFEQNRWGGSERNTFWQADPYPAFFGINRAGAVATCATCQGAPCDIAGVLPDDQRRGDCDRCRRTLSCFTWPPVKTGYTYEALQGALAQAVIHGRRGKPAWSTGGEAIRRAFEWLADPQRGNQPITDTINGSDDWWQAWIVNRVYGTSLPEVVPARPRPGKAIGYADWTAIEPTWPASAPSR